MFGVAFLQKPPPAPRRRVPAPLNEADRRLLASNLELPLYVRERVEAYMLDHPGSTFRTVVMTGFRALGIEIEDEDLIPERAMRRLRKREAVEGDAPTTRKQTSIRVPRYVRVRAEEYLLDHPEMRFRHLIMAGLRELGIDINSEDLVAERQNVLASARREQD
jgi:hypothetical protein